MLTPHLAIIPSGPQHPNPVGLLSSDRMRHVISAAAEQFDWVILDSAPVNLLSDALVMTRLSDGVLLVVRANQSRLLVVRRAIETIGRHRIVGVVFNGETRSSPEYDYYSHYYERPETS